MYPTLSELMTRLYQYGAKIREFTNRTADQITDIDLEEHERTVKFYMRDKAKLDYALRDNGEPAISDRHFLLDEDAKSY